METGYDDIDLNDLAWKFVRILQDNSPVRDPAGTVYKGTYKTGKRAGKPYKRKMPQEIKWHGEVVSPYPGNLKNNGTVVKQQSESWVTAKHGYRPAPYAMYANARSRKPQYIEKSIEEFKSYLFANGWEEDMGEPEGDE